MDNEIRKTLEDICIYIGISTHWKDDATVRTYIERLIKKSLEKQNG